MDIGKRFQALRTEKGISIYRLAKLSEVSEGYIRKVERGTNQPTVLILEKLLSYLGINLIEFFNESDDALYPTPFERELVACVRMLNDEQASALLHIAKLFAQ